MIELIFKADLQQLIQKNRRHSLSADGSLTHELLHPASIKDLIESCGIPHTEVDVLLVNNNSVSFEYQVKPSDQIIVYPPSQANDIEYAIHLAPATPLQPRFVIDIHLGKLVKLLRLGGFDSLYQTDYDDAALARISAEDDRILLTRDKKLLMRSCIKSGYLIRSTQPEKQFIEVLDRYQLKAQVQLFSRCTTCNGLLEPVNKSDVIDELQANTANYFDAFWRCRSCRQVYWKGSHYDNMLHRMQALLV